MVRTAVGDGISTFGLGMRALAQWTGNLRRSGSEGNRPCDEP
jgi:hypothetical protein